ncbi:MATE family efflux transporter [Maribrevibacterium harenarium]|uniref:Multidrug export protein MepA n=1 Tax=Maribrevibacterium harenarium TaxID=2589817 RepID=A0A501WJ15_9GAMM|nr:MATE family efflux transporter [Maribrevibacterium harenarium]TPE49489.1 MATE family efflux transporter [Maribrevibacterium harenarium]
MEHASLSITGSVQRTFWRFAIPSVAGMLVNGLYQVIDGLFVGHFVGASGLAAMNLAWPILGLIIGFGILVGMGGGAIMSQQRGAGDNAKASSSLTASLWLILLLSIVSSGYLAFSGSYLLSLQGAEATAYQWALDYINVFQWGAIMTIASGALPMLVRNDDRPNLATLLLGIGALLNIVLDYLMLGYWNLGLKGAAIATVISQATVAVFTMLYFCSNKASIRLVLEFINFKHLMQVLKTGSSGLVMFLYFSFIVAAHNTLLLKYGSVEYVSAFAIINYIALLYYLIAEGLANGIQPPISYYYGAKQPKHIKTTMTLALKIVLGLGLCTTLIANVFSEQLIGFFTTQQTGLVQITIEGMRLHLFALCLDGFLFVASVYFLSVGQNREAMLVALGNIVIQIPFLLAFPTVLGTQGIWLALPLSNVVLSIIVAPILIRSLSHRTEPVVEIKTKHGLPFF